MPFPSAVCFIILLKRRYTIRFNVWIACHTHVRRSTPTFCVIRPLCSSFKCFTTFIYWSRFSSLKYRWKERHTDIILSKKKKGRIIISCDSLCATKTQNDFRAYLRFRSICSVFAIRMRKLSKIKLCGCEG